MTHTHVEGGNVNVKDKELPSDTTFSGRWVPVVRTGPERTPDGQPIDLESQRGIVATKRTRTRVLVDFVEFRLSSWSSHGPGVDGL